MMAFGGGRKTKSFFDFGRQSEKGSGDVQYTLLKTDWDTRLTIWQNPFSGRKVRQINGW